MEASQDADAGEDGDGEAGDEQPESPAQAKGGHKRGGGFQRKIEKRDRHIDQLTRQNAQLMEMLQGRSPQQPAQEQKPLTEGEKAAKELDDYVQQRVQRTLAQERVAAEQKRVFDELERQKDEARARHPDFDEALESVSDIELPAHVHEAILTSEHKAEIMYSLSKDRAELVRIRALPPLQAALAVGRLEAKAASGATQQPPTRRAARPPTPIVPVSTRGASSTKRTEDMSYDEYKAWRKQGGGR